MRSKDVKEIIKKVRDEGRHALLEPEAKMLISYYGIPVTKGFMARSKDEALEAAKKIGYPVVLKIVSPDVLHKSDVGGVRVGISNDKELLEPFDGIIENVKKAKPRAKIMGIYVQEYVPEGREVIIGLIKDPQFGPTVMFGLGGIFVEVLKDVSFRIAPMSKKDAEEMIKEIRGYPILRGVRGNPPVDFEALENALVAVSKLGWELKEIKEMDLNPVIAYHNGLKVVDARIILEE